MKLTENEKIALSFLAPALIVLGSSLLWSLTKFILNLSAEGEKLDMLHRAATMFFSGLILIGFVSVFVFVPFGVYLLTKK